MERTNHGLFVFPPKKTLIWRRHCSIDQSCCSLTSKQFLESSSGMKFVYPSVRLANQKPGTFVSVRYTNQIALFPFVCFFCFVRAFSFQGHTKIALVFGDTATKEGGHIENGFLSSRAILENEKTLGTRLSHLAAENNFSSMGQPLV